MYLCVWCDDVFHSLFEPGATLQFPVALKRYVFALSTTLPFFINSKWVLVRQEVG